MSVGALHQQWLGVLVQVLERTLSQGWREGCPAVAGVGEEPPQPWGVERRAGL